MLILAMMVPQYAENPDCLILFSFFPPPSLLPLSSLPLSPPPPSTPLLRFLTPYPSTCHIPTRDPGLACVAELVRNRVG